jgi:tripeptidyl-peptidase-1
VHFSRRVPEDPARLRKRVNLGQPSSAHGPKTNGGKVDVTLSLANCDEFITPECLRALYDFNYVPKETAKNSYGIGKLLTRLFLSFPLNRLSVEFTPQAYLASDLDLFFK